MRVTEKSLFFFFFKLVVIIFLTIDNLLLQPLPSIKATSIKTIYPAHYNREPLKCEMRVT